MTPRPRTVSDEHILMAAQHLAGEFAATFKEFPPIQKPNTFTIDDAIGKMREATAAD